MEARGRDSGQLGKGRIHEIGPVCAAHFEGVIGHTGGAHKVCWVELHLGVWRMEVGGTCIVQGM